MYFMKFFDLTTFFYKYYCYTKYALEIQQSRFLVQSIGPTYFLNLKTSNFKLENLKKQICYLRKMQICAFQGLKKSIVHVLKTIFFRKARNFSSINRFDVHYFSHFKLQIFAPNQATVNAAQITVRVLAINKFDGIFHISKQDNWVLTSLITMNFTMLMMILQRQLT